MSGRMLMASRARYGCPWGCCRGGGSAKSAHLRGHREARSRERRAWMLEALEDADE